MSCNKLFENIDSLYEQYLKVWEEVCTIESPTKHKAGVDKVGEYFAHMALKRGWQVEYQKNHIAGNAVCITMNPSAPEKPICLSGHMDTVHPCGSFGETPVRRDNEKIYGPGVTDCKGGIVAAFLAMDALYKCGFNKRPVKLLLQSDEEVSSSLSGKATIEYICKEAEDSVAFLNLEGSTPGEACLVRKGIATFTFTVEGKEAHASKCASEGANAILDAAYKIIELEKLKDPEGLTCCCSVINGGTTANTVPGKCQFKANVRFATASQLEWVREYMEKLAATEHVKGCKCSVTHPKARVAMELCERNIKLLEKLNSIFRENNMPELKVSKRTGGSYAADITAYGIPCVDSLGVSGGNIHTQAEFAYLDSLKACAKRVAAVVYCF